MAGKEALSKILILFLLSFFLSSTIHSFGKNRVIYNPGEWSVIITPHYRLYLPESELFLSNGLSGSLEAIFSRYELAFGSKPIEKLKVILYQGQIDFQQNNISGGSSPGTGGFTEFLHGRVVLPLLADKKQFEHVLAHELAHAFQISAWGRGIVSGMGIRDLDIPLWLIEGGAEYISIGVDPDGEMLIADAVVHGNLPDLNALSRPESLDPSQYFFIYQQGALFYEYAASVLGTNAFTLVVQGIGRHRGYQAFVSNVFNTDPDTLNARFMDYLRARYMPQAAVKKLPLSDNPRLIRRDSGININPVSLDSNRVAFLSDRKLYPSVLVYEIDTAWVSTLLKGGLDETALELRYASQNHLAVSSNGLLCLVTRSGGREAIQVINLSNGRRSELILPFREIRSPDISADGLVFLFTGVTNQQSRLWLYNSASGSLSMVIAPSGFNSEPRFGNNGYWLVNEDSAGHASLVYLPLNGSNAVRLDFPMSIANPAVSPSGRYVAFIARAVHPELWVLDTFSNSLAPVFTPAGGVFTPSFRDDTELLVSVYSRSSYNLYTVKLPGAYVFTNSARFQEVTNALERDTVIPADISNTVIPYSPEFAVDSLLGGLSINSIYGFGIVGLFSMSDLLGDHRLSLVLDTVIYFSRDWYDHLNIDVSYAFMKYRLQLGIRLYHFSNYFYEFSTLQDFFNVEAWYRKTWGILGIASYPFSTFDRLDLVVGVKGFIYQTNTMPDLTRSQFSISYVHDATLNDITGPVDGMRYEASLSVALPIFADSLDYQRLVLDWRGYVLITPGYSLAFRAVAGTVTGADSSRFPFILGGPGSLRGYDYNAFSGNAVFLANAEFRFPLIPRWMIGLPAPIPMPTIWGAVFFDLGSAFDTALPFTAFEWQGDTLRLIDLKSGLGMGLRLVILQGIKLMVDWAVPYTGGPIPSFEQWRTFWQIGIDF